jgi:lipopolysaccharide transport system permease protein
MSDQQNQEIWDEVIKPAKKMNIFSGEILAYKDLILLFVRRDFVKEFKQTILGPVWFLIQPLFQTLVLFFVFGNLGKMGPTGIPQFSFYLGGTIIWTLFSENLIKSSETFRANSAIFGKVYFPRLVMPASTMITNFLKLGVQMLLFLVVYFYELSTSDLIQPNYTICLVPIYFVLASLLGLGMGLIISALTTKYWDLRFLIQFSLQLVMFLSTVITPYYVVASKGMLMKFIIMANPVSSYIEAFRHAFLGNQGGWFYAPGLIYSVLVTFFVLIFGVYTFKKVERNFMDTI